MARRDLPMSISEAQLSAFEEFCIGSFCVDTVNSIGKELALVSVSTFVVSDTSKVKSRSVAERLLVGYV